MSSEADSQSYLLENGGYYDEYRGYYDANGNYYSYDPNTGEYTLVQQEVQSKSYPNDNNHDEDGRLIVHKRDDSYDPEPDLQLFTSLWRFQRMASLVNNTYSTFVWPHIPRMVKLKRLDLFESQNPHCQQGTTDAAESRRIRHSAGLWHPVQTVFLIDEPMEFTKEFCIESAGPPRRSKVDTVDTKT